MNIQTNMIFALSGHHLRNEQKKTLECRSTPSLYSENNDLSSEAFVSVQTLKRAHSDPSWLVADYTPGAMLREQRPPET